MVESTLPGLEFDRGGNLPTGINRVANRTGEPIPLCPIRYSRERDDSPMGSDFAAVAIYCLVGGVMVALPAMSVAYAAYAVGRRVMGMVTA